MKMLSRGFGGVARWPLTKVCFKLQFVSIAVLLERQQHDIELCKPASSVAMMRMAESVWVFTMW